MFSGILVSLALISVFALVLKKLALDKKLIVMAELLRARTRVWWAMCGVFAVAALTGGTGSILVFALTSFLLLREFITITPTRKGDHHSLFWVFFIVLPLQYYLLSIGWYGMFIILIPVYAFLFIPLCMALDGDTFGFLERAAKIQWALMTCVYCISHAPAVLKISFPGGPGEGLRLLLYLCVIVQFSDVTQSLAAQTPFKVARPLAVGIVASAVLGGGLWWATPFSLMQSAAMAVLITIMGAAGNLCYQAIMKDRGKPAIVVVRTRPSIMERVMSLCFAAPIFFHIVRYFFTDRSPTSF